MRYLYYPGCSLEGTAQEYDAATRSVMQAMGVELIDIDDWTCCGATAADSTSRLLSLVLPARNLALAEKMNPGLDVLVPCSACYLNLKKVDVKVNADPALLKEINTVLAVENLTLASTTKVRHLLDVLANDIGPRRLARKVTRPLNGLSIAPYYGCQCLRPYPVFDDPENPRAMEGLIRATAADVFEWSMGPKCCGASQMNTHMEIGLELSGALLAGARGADAIATVCPMCQMNLEAYQSKLSRQKSVSLQTTIVYLPQLLGLAMGLTEKDLKMNLNLAITEGFRMKLSRLSVEQQAAV